MQFYNSLFLYSEFYLCFAYSNNHPQSNFIQHTLKSQEGKLKIFLKIESFFLSKPNVDYSVQTILFK